MILLGLDPGESTGFAVVDTEQESTFVDGLGAILEFGVMDGWREVERLIVAHKPNTIVIEKFVLYPNRAAAQSYSPMIPSQVIGVIKYLAEQHGIPCIEQTASSGKSFMLSDELYTHLYSPHARDAARHVGVYLYSRGMLQHV